ncbi:hypothetical protein MIMGU_mgv1a0091312mg, partial [Erythranthe guttata]
MHSSKLDEPIFTKFQQHIHTSMSKISNIGGWQQCVLISVSKPDIDAR